MGNVLDLIQERLIIGKFPITFMKATSATETVLEEGMQITLPWRSLERAIVRGPQLTVIPVGPDPNPIAFTTGPIPPIIIHNASPPGSDEGSDLVLLLNKIAVLPLHDI